MQHHGKLRVIAFYLPQFHPIPENDNWWGKGFTEWTNVGKAKKFFPGHYQPRIPADLGYYDLRVPEIREAQAELAKQYGIEGFIYWHYWFGNGKQLLERPFNEVLSNGKPDFPFCLAWANETWKGFSHGLKNRNILIQQNYGGIDDYTEHFYKLLPAFKDSRYITVDGKPLFMIYRPLADPEIVNFINVWRKLARENGLNGIYFVGQNMDAVTKISDVMATGVDAVNSMRLFDFSSKRSFIEKIYGRINKIFRNRPQIVSYRKASGHFLKPDEDTLKNVFPSIIPGWDHTPRSGREGLVFTGATPELFERHVRQVISAVKDRDHEHRIVFIKSWNEWAEGNYMEPDLKWGKAFLEALWRQIR